MVISTLYLVEKNYSYLRLAGPFQYPEWHADKQKASLLTYAKAHQCAAVFGGVAKAAE